MPNSNYRKGADFERKLVKEAREDGKIAFRSAGSHSPIDVIIIDFKMRMIDLLQCKAGLSYTANFKEKLKQKLSFLDGNYLIKTDVVEREFDR